MTRVSACVIRYVVEQRIQMPSCSLNHSLTHSLTHPPTHPITHPPTHYLSLKFIRFDRHCHSMHPVAVALGCCCTRLLSQLPNLPHMNTCMYGGVCGKVRISPVFLKSVAHLCARNFAVHLLLCIFVYLCVQSPMTI